ncbi:nitrous oxide reductase family maturation protein NosD [Motiliproteus coralliicola]|uniref:Nitrous oxide reductase family maturation protein NosD n=1 Tax=Motiliproteus coralliicola TaxID=2283196 RepID=A0A369W8Q0_9GAMM|nr:nitrous oxide reductase family maturation protein NosD [Motiliproteus coralliicola]RDE18282.1 nitrous oxide reductase family maturation protein NosD [Motiliproteus coralliicola]
MFRYLPLKCPLTLVLLASTQAMAAQIAVSPQQSLQAAIDASQSGDQLVLEAGTYQGNFVIDKPLTLTGSNGVVLDGNGADSTLTLKSDGITVENLKIQNWGDDLTELDAGIFVGREATGAVIQNNYFQGTTSGIWVDATKDIRILSNKIEGNLDIRSQDRGNGIHLYAVGGALVKDNEVWHTRDGIYIDTSNGNELISNYLHDLRYGVHYMYSYSNKVIDNHTKNTRTGYALMQSKHLTVVNNRSEDDQNYGILMNFITNSRVEQNHVMGVQTGRNPHLRQGSNAISGAEGKALFMYNSVFNEIVSNQFNESDLGIHLTAGSEDNVISGNTFISNKEQVKYVSNRKQDWSKDGRGNYWSDYLGWDMNDDGIGDTHYEPNDGVDKLLWKYPAVKVLLNSPAVETLRWVQRQFPVLKSPGVFDSAPLMNSPFDSNGALVDQQGQRKQTQAASEELTQR